MVQTVTCNQPRPGQNGKKNIALTTKIRHKRRIILFMWTLWFAYLSFTHEIQPASCAYIPTSGVLDDREPHLNLKWQPLTGYTGNVLKATPNDTNSESDYPDYENQLVDGFNCTRPAILDFPPDLFTQAQRENGAIIIHFIASLYVFYAVALVCDEYFVPSIEAICGELHMPSDVAGATFMAIATSAPELFTNVIGTFITEGDIGVGTIVGSAVFNILAVCACCGFAANTALPLDWYPLTRDCLFYSISVILLIIVIGNSQVFWYEALILVSAYSVYIFVMWKNAAFKKASENFVHTIGKKFGCISNSSTKRISNAGEKTPLLREDNTPVRIETKFGADDEKDIFTPKHVSQRDDDDVEVYDEILIAKALHKNEEDAENEDSNYDVFKFPHGEGFIAGLEWVCSWPARFVFSITIPDCRRSRFRKFYPLTFIMCIVYIALLSYVVSWVMTVIGHTFRIPDSVMGLTFIAAGTSVPEAVSSIIVARQGLGSMSISNSIGSNTFDILMCLGLPWLIKASMIANNAEENFIQINSEGIEYSVIILMISLVLLYAILACNKFYLDKKVATIALAMYALFLVFASLFEMNVFFMVNLPTCDIASEL